MAIETILFLRPGETPWQYSANPGELPGPWGDTAEEAIERLRADTGDVVVEYWERDTGLWVITESAQREHAEREARYGRKPRARLYGAGYSDASPTQVRLRQDQREVLEAAASAAGMPLSAYLREAALLRAGREDLCDYPREVKS